LAPRPGPDAEGDASPPDVTPEAAVEADGGVDTFDGDDDTADAFDGGE
jgi:hypothetical protein